MLHALRGILRLLFFIGALIIGITILLSASLFVRDKQALGMRIRQRFIPPVLYVLGVKVELRGKIPAGGGLLVANHRSYVDPVIILRDILAVPVAKKEIISWPIIGYGARISGTLFVDRGDSEQRRLTREAIGKTIAQGLCIINFPEGTTHDEPKTIKFHSGAFREAVDGGYPVFPLAIEYRAVSDAWAGEDTFLPHFIRCFGKRQTEIKIHYGDALTGDDAEQILNQAKAFIDSTLVEFRKEWQGLEPSAA